MLRTMRSVIVIHLIVLILKLHCVTAIITSADRIESAGYLSESHDIATQDGYGMTIFRIRNPSSQETSASAAPVVLMMHGLLSSSDCWVIRGLTDTLAYDLVDAGYDVWLGNSRGNTYGRRHVNMSSDDPEFWRYSWYEIATIDLPTMIDYILGATQQSAMHYVGHSQGTTVVFVLLSQQPEYRDKLKSTHMLAPVAYMKNVRSLLFNLLAPFVGRYSALDPLVGDSALLQQPILRQIFGLDKCRSPMANPAFCTAIVFLIFGGYSAYFNQSLLQEAFDTHPATASTHQAIHYIQLLVSGYFRQYDFGTAGNRDRYNQKTPPDYNVANINPRLPFHFYYSDYDELSTRKDVERFSDQLGDRCVKHFVPLKNFAHIDFLWAYNIGSVINRHVLRLMDEEEELLQ